jgi:hypothetical protein
MNPKAYTSAQLRAMREQPTTNTRAELREWIQCTLETIILAVMAAALALLLWAI